MSQETVTSTTWVVQVPVATVWTSPESPREIDAPGISNPIDLQQWHTSLTYEPRLALSDENLIQSQLLYGEEVLLVDIQGEWAHIIVPTQPSRKDERGYPGWVPLTQLRELPSESWTGNGVAVVKTRQATLYDPYKEPFLDVSYLTTLPVQTKEKDFVGVLSPHGGGYFSVDEVAVYPSLEDIPKGTGEDILKSGEVFVDLPYFWGGMSSFGYDCSGFTYNMHKAQGYEIPRDAHDQAESGKKVDLDHLQPGDLLFFAYDDGKGKLHHVGLYYGDGKMLHSPNTGKNIEIIDLKDTIYEKELCSARRYWEEKEENV